MSRGTLHCGVATTGDHTHGRYHDDGDRSQYASLQEPLAVSSSAGGATVAMGMLIGHSEIIETATSSLSED